MSAMRTIFNGPFRIDVSPDPYSLTIYRNGKLILSNYPRNDLQAGEIKQDADQSISMKFATSNERELDLYLSIKRNLLTVNWGANSIYDFRESYRISSGGYWYGGGFLNPQYFPLNDGDIDLAWFPHSNVQTPYWYTSSGVGILVHDYKPMNWSFDSDHDGQFRIGKKDRAFKYHVIMGESARDVFYSFIEIVGRPIDSPPDIAFTRPIYSTWAQYKTAIDQEKTLQYAGDTIAKGFPIGTMEIDDKWEVHYGDFEFDSAKFPEPKSMVAKLHEMGFVVTLWVYPFINLDSKNYSYAKDNNLLVKDRGGKPLTVKWWNGQAGDIDFTNPLAVNWFKEKLLQLQKDYGFDGFKFDAGDASFYPEGSVAAETIPSSEFGDRYMKFIVGNFQKYSETRVSTFAQALGLLTRHGDKDSKWGLDNGLHSVITTTLCFSTIGYPYVLPDMIGGNEYGLQRCDSELLIRWIEVSSPMPSIQFSIIPWRQGYDDYTIFLNKEYAWLHHDLAPYILQLVKGNLKDGSPINRPLFFDHDEHNLYGVDDEFMLGESLLFAPVVTQNATSRDIKLPNGHWIDLWDGKEYGVGIIREFPAPLYKLPAFMNLNRPLDHSMMSRVRSRFLQIEEGAKALEKR